MALTEPYSAIALMAVTASNRSRNIRPSDAATLKCILIHGIAIVGVADARRSVSKMSPIRSGVTASNTPTTATRLNETSSTQLYGRT